MRILFTGGGTLGSVMPLLAVWEQCGSGVASDALWIGTRSGPEKKFVRETGIPFQSIYGGKMRRYADVRNAIDPFFVLIGFIQSCIHIIRFNPDVIINAGSYIGVPTIIAGRLFGRRCIIWQLDIHPSLSNRVTAMWAHVIAVSTKDAGKSYKQKKIHEVGVPVRKSIQQAKIARNDDTLTHLYRSRFGIFDDLPILLIVGGGTGATAINELIWKARETLTRTMHIIHVTGSGKESGREFSDEHYHQLSLIDDLSCAYAIATIVITRAGMGTISELAYLRMPSIVIPLPNSKQEKNADFLKSTNAAVVFEERSLSFELLTKEVAALLYDTKKQTVLKENIHGCLQSNPVALCSFINGI